MGAARQGPPVDLLVIGGGMAGLTAAAWVARHGGRAVVVERAGTLGGSAALAGFVWTAPTLDVLRAVNPRGDSTLAAALVEGFPAGTEWIRSLGVECRPTVTVLRFGRGHQVDTNHYIGACAELLHAHGAEVLTGTQTRSLLLADGAVRGAECVLADGSTRRIEARWTLLATGGFQADPDLRAEHIHPRARAIELRSNPYSMGAGLRLGRSAGGTFGKDGAGFYGHLIPAGVALDNPAHFTDVTLYYSERCLLFNLGGERFVDETVGDHLTTLALLEQPEARGLLVADAAAYRSWMKGQYVEGIPAVNTFEICRRRGARAAVANDVDEFELIPEEWGYPGAKIRDAINALNLAARGGDALSPPREFDRRPLDEPPFYVIEAAPAITFTFGGLLIDRHARVRARDGDVVPGLLAAGADAGGLYHGAYAGGLAPALVFGLAAARTALAAEATR
ncbi:MULTISPECIES: FAD-binding protein [unclassified Pseudofrankia]|uniref:FAD-dependent oxidoreductase n=1 Tax=unclassified Pseudofrankia TaxID=2994372 RepID=UPI0008D9D24D|nr:MULTISPECIES: FAD-binding protein [unclassified Pseudofrankia]MDT3446557.1 FAD-binding protein [Pseudofrankia sp. BMG5.37]OHV58700.1 cytochrome C [Pseudofrankia sp. BMG5.36]